MMPIQTAEGVRLEISQQYEHDFLRGYWRITASGKCCCGRAFSDFATLPEKIIEYNHPLVALLTDALVELIIERRNNHLRECAS